MPTEEKKFRFFLCQAFHLPQTSKYVHRTTEGPKEKRLMNYDNVKHLLEDVEWELHPGPLAPYGDWPVENREEFAYVAAARLPIIREACESGKYNAIVLSGRRGARVHGVTGDRPPVQDPRDRLRLLPDAHRLASGQQVQRHRHRRKPQHVLLQPRGPAPLHRPVRLDPEHQLSPPPPRLRRPLVAPYREGEGASRGAIRGRGMSRSARRSPRSKRTAPRSSPSAAPPPSGSGPSSRNGCTTWDGRYRSWRGTAALSNWPRRWSASGST